MGDLLERRFVAADEKCMLRDANTFRIHNIIAVDNEFNNNGRINIEVIQ